MSNMTPQTTTPKSAIDEEEYAVDWETELIESYLDLGEGDTKMQADVAHTFKMACQESQT